MIRTENLYLPIFRNWIENLEKDGVKFLSHRGSFDDGWFDVTFELNECEVYLLLNNDVVQIYDRYVRRKSDNVFLHATDAVSDFSPEQFKIDLEKLFQCLNSGRISEYFGK